MARRKPTGNGTQQEPTEFKKNVMTKAEFEAKKLKMEKIKAGKTKPGDRTKYQWSIL